MKQAKQESKPYESLLPKQYVKALRKVQQHILDNPKTFAMDTWGDVEASQENTCQTVGCICGWMAILSTPKTELKPVLRFEEKMAQAQVAALSANTPDDYSKLMRKWKQLGLRQTERGIPSLITLVSEYKDEIPSEFSRDFDKLFYLENWPSKFRKTAKDGYAWTTTPKKAVARIDYFLQHGR